MFPMPLNVRQRNLNTKNVTKRNSSFNKGKKTKNGKTGDYIVTNAPSEMQTIAYVGGLVALILLIVCRVMASNWAIISDCDETYNYWEPLHYLVYGNGLQTWEYSPKYALRSYASLWFFAFPAKLFSYFGNSISVFYRLRLLQAIVMAFVELLFYKSICREFGLNIGRIWLFLNLPAAGCFLSSTSMLPSSWSSILTTLAVACWWKQHMAGAIFATAANVLLSWPFTALLGLPIALDYLFVHPEVIRFLCISIVALIVIMVPMIAIDSSYYGKLVVAPWNIVKYNVFSENGPDLYGVEDWTYYLFNGLLNFNVVWLLCLVCPILLGIFSFLISNNAARRPAFSSSYWLSLMPLYLWLAVFWTQPHKEERFLYPVYNLILLAAAISIDCLQKLSYAIWREVNVSWRRAGHYLFHTKPIMMLFLFIAAAGGITRIYAVCKNYSSPIHILHKLPPVPTELSYVCFGKDWYRSPSSFHLPHPKYRIRFIASKFAGQMPAPYTEDAGGTTIVHPYFNDENKGVNTSYLYPTQCHYLVHSDLGKPNAHEPDYSTQKDNWQILSVAPLIDAENSHTFLRAFDIPFLSKKHNRYANLYLLRNRHFTTI